MRLEVDAATVLFPVAIAGRIRAIAPSADFHQTLVRAGAGLIGSLLGSQQIFEADHRAGVVRIGREDFGGLDADGAGRHVLTVVLAG